MTLQKWGFRPLKDFQSLQDVNAGKLRQCWKGLYRVRSIAGKVTYDLKTMKGKVLPLNWN